jgi:putative SOS response-associated peptidase YedK
MPIIVSSKYFNDEEDAAKRTIIPAIWSIIPKYHKGDYRKHGLTTNNARLESLEQSKLYKPLLEKNKRCVMVIEGFYEWNTTNVKQKSSERSVYFIHMPQMSEKIKVEDKSTWSCEEIKLMHVAGLFDVWHDENGDTIYSFTIITFESDDKFSWLHHRTPAILETEDQIRDWLDYERIPSKEALKMIKHPKMFTWYQVSNYVNNMRNQSEQCNKPINTKLSSLTPSKGNLLGWVKKRKDNEDNDDEKQQDEPGTSSSQATPKRIKKE